MMVGIGRWVVAAAVAATVAACGGGDNAGKLPGQKHRLSIEVVGSGSVNSTPSGIISCSTSCTADLLLETTVVLTAAPAAGHALSAWGGACSGSASTCTVTMNQARSVSATFVSVGSGTTLALGVVVVGSGTVSSQPAGINCSAGCSASFQSGSLVTLTATPSIGQELSAWSGACTGNTTTCTVTMSAAQSVTATFSAATAAGWSSTVTALSDGGSGDAKVVMDNDGRAVAVWLRLDPGTASDSLVASRFESATGWSTPLVLDASPRDVMDFELAMDPGSGRAAVLWTQASDTSPSAAWARRFDPANGWAPVQAIQSASTPTGQVDRLSVGIDAQGNVVAAWSQMDDSRFSIWGNRATAAGAWGSAQLLEAMDELGRVDGNPRIAVAPQGDAIVVWQASGGTTANRGAWTNRYTTGAGWGLASQLVAVSGGSAPDIAVDASGNAVVVWAQTDVVSSTQMYALIQARRFQAGAWGPALQVARELGANSVLSRPVVKMNAQGMALVAWGQGDLSIRATMAPAGGAWPTPTVIKHIGSRDATSALVCAMDGQGNAMVAWAQPSNLSGTDGMLSTRTAAGAWTAGTIHQGAIWAHPFVAMNDRGNALYLWTQYLDTPTGTQIRARQYTSGR